jgi:hypothetical protein
MSAHGRKAAHKISGHLLDKAEAAIESFLDCMRELHLRVGRRAAIAGSRHWRSQTAPRTRGDVASSGLPHDAPVRAVFDVGRRNGSRRTRSSDVQLNAAVSAHARCQDRCHRGQGAPLWFRCDNQSSACLNGRSSSISGPRGCHCQSERVATLARDEAIFAARSVETRQSEQ